MVGSTRLGEQLDPEVLRGVQERYFDALRTTIERHGGTVEKFIGDAVMAVFGIPTLHEDDALRAVRAAADLTPALEPLNRELEERRGLRIELRVGVNTGKVVASDPDGGGGALVTGDAVNVAARLQQEARPGEVLLGPLTFHLVRDAVSAEALEVLHLRGRDDAVAAHRLLAITGTEARARHLDAPIVGRERELGILAAELERAITERSCRMVTVLAPAGVGKSRLTREFVERVGVGVRVLRGRCLSYGDGITFWPIAEILRAAAGLDDRMPPEASREAVRALVAEGPEPDQVAAILNSLLGLADAAAAAEDIAWAVRRSLALLAHERPLIVVVEDIHWAEPGLLDLLEAMVDWTRDAALLLVCPARPDLLDRRPSMGNDRENATSLRLEPLEQAAAEALIDALPGGEAVPARLRARITTVAEGNPLFVEEMLGMLVDDGRIWHDGERWIALAGIAATEVPASINALLAARIDGLEPSERSLAERASVVGREFERAAVMELTPSSERSDLSGRLLSLTRKELIRAGGSGLRGDETFRFRHILIRDAAYDLIPKRERAELHVRFADWLERVVADRRAEYLEIIGHHLAEAAAYSLEIGLDEAAHGELPERAVGCLLEAAERAERSHRYDDAARLYGRASSIVERAGERRAFVLSPIDLLARGAEDEFRAGRLSDAVETARRAIRALGADAPVDPTIAGRLWERLGDYLCELRRRDETEEAFGRALSLLPEEPASPERARALASYGRFLMLSDRFDEARPICEAAIVTAAACGAVTAEASALTSLGAVLGSTGARDAGIEYLQRGLERARLSGDGFELVRAYANLSIVLSDAGRRADASTVLEEGYAELERLGFARGMGVKIVAGWCDYLIYDGRLEEAVAKASEALALDPPDMFAEQLWAVYGAALSYVARFADAGRALAEARRWSHRGDLQPAVRGDLELVDGRRAAWSGQFAEARARFAEALTFAPDHGDLMTVLAAEAIASEATCADTARARSDTTTAAMASAEALRWRERAAESPGEAESFTPIGRVALTRLEPELGRALGRPDPDGWANAVRRAADEQLRPDEVYARWRHAEALADAGRSCREVEPAVVDAYDQARRIGATYFVGELEGLAARLGIARALERQGRTLPDARLR